MQFTLPIKQKANGSFFEITRTTKLESCLLYFLRSFLCLVAPTLITGAVHLTGYMASTPA